ncbi:hypothetical protein [Rhodococcus qingshengii]|uniref:hypothetical protein n=1 Tax=Rhodococcus qingshengii TaxID=334542 RepID=UPI0018D3A91A|nr:hypothetical protein [Rhodococcus qingshengii]
MTPSPTSARDAPVRGGSRYIALAIAYVTTAAVKATRRSLIVRTSPIFGDGDVA